MNTIIYWIAGLLVLYVISFVISYQLSRALHKRKYLEVDGLSVYLVCAPVINSVFVIVLIVIWLPQLFKSDTTAEKFFRVYEDDK